MFTVEKDGAAPKNTVSKAVHTQVEVTVILKNVW